MKKYLSLLFTLIFSVTSIAPGFAVASAAEQISAEQTATAAQMPVNMSATDKLVALENMLYGTEQPGALVTRTDSLEDDIYGTVTKDSILTRIDNLYHYLQGSDSTGEASFLIKLNAIEWQFNESMAGGPAKNRIEAVESMIEGKVGEGPLATRLETLAGLAFQDGIVAVERVTLPKDSVVKVEFTQELSSRVAKAGDVVHYKVADNLFVNNVLVLPKGATGIGHVKKVVPPRSFGRDARIDVDFGYIFAIDNSKVKVFIGELAKQEAKTVAGAAGAAIGGMIVLGPIGAIGGAFVTGKAVVIPPGSVTYVQVEADSDITGMVYQAK